MDIAPQLEALEGHLKAKEVSVGDFCDQIDVHRATWQRWKSGKTSPSLEAWPRLIKGAGKLGFRFKVPPAVQAIIEAAKPMAGAA